MLKSILLGLEDSAGTERATELGFALATTHGAVVGLTIIDEPDIAAGAAMGIGGATFKHDRDRAVLEDARRRARELEERFSVQCRRAAVSSRVLEITGHPAEAILSEIDSHVLVLLGRDANFSLRDRISRQAA
ncbi:MAG TPA: universal stress protein [Polyangia bacterium]|nr:universal stress protein [Polyangia bacterium]